MKTTLELPDELLIEAKAVAARRRTTLKAMIEHSLRREIGFPSDSGSESITELNAQGFPVIKRADQPVVTSELVYSLLDEESSSSPR